MIATCVPQILLLLCIPPWFRREPGESGSFRGALRARVGRGSPPAPPRVPAPRHPLPPAGALRVASSTRRGCRGESGRLQICPGGTAATSQPVIAKQTRLKYWDWSQS